MEPIKVGSPTEQNKDKRLCGQRTAFFIERKSVMRELNFYLLDMKYIRALAKSDDNVMSIGVWS